MSTTADERLLSLSQAGRRLDLSASRLRQMTDSGQLDCIRTPLGRLIRESDIEALRVEREEARSAARAS